MLCLYGCSVGNTNWFDLLILVLKHCCVLPPQVRKGAIGAKCGLLFAYNDSEPFDADKHFKRFKKYDSWDHKDYKEFVQDRYVTFLVCNVPSGRFIFYGANLHNIVAHKRQQMLITWTLNGACLGVCVTMCCLAQCVWVYFGLCMRAHGQGGCKFSENVFVCQLTSHCYLPLYPPHTVTCITFTFTHKHIHFSTRILETSEEEPIGWFEVEEDWNDVEIKLQQCRVSKVWTCCLSFFISVCLSITYF